MDDSAKLTLLKNMVDETNDDVLSAYLTLAGKKIIAKAYPYDPTQTTVPVQYEYLQLEIAAFMINKRGAEGQITHSENGIQRQYESGDVPASMLKTITPYCGSLRTPEVQPEGEEG